MKLIQAGLGWWGRTWAELLQAHPHVELAAVVDPQPDAREWAGETLGLPAERRFAALPEALAASDVPGVVITTPPETHRGLVLAALAAGRHVLLEKPLAVTMDDAREVVAAARRAGRLVVVTQQYRFRPAARVARGLMREGAIGELLAVRASFHKDTRTIFGDGDFRYRMRHPLVLDMMIHHADLLRAVTGREVRTVDARGWRVPDSPYVHDPAVAALQTLDQGAVAVYDGNWAAHGSETSWDADWEMIGTAGRLLWTGATEASPHGKVSCQRWGAALKSVEVPAPERADREIVLEGFLRGAKTGEPAATDATDNIRSLAIVLAGVESIETERIVEIAD
jgi:predicted dehydrogenase